MTAFWVNMVAVLGLAVWLMIGIGILICAINNTRMR